MTATFYVGDVLDVLGKLPENSVDLILSSPPFWSLRSYLPQDHPSKGFEIGSEPSPGEYIDKLIDVVEALDRVLAPHGSMVLELADTYAGSGGAGGDYDPGGWREGQEAFEGSGKKHIDAKYERIQYGGHEGSLRNLHGKQQRGGHALPKSLSLIPESFRFAMVYGQNPFTGRQTERWRLRNVIRWVRPNPPVGALGDKFRPATSELMVFCKSAKRYFDLDATREAPMKKPQRFLSQDPVRSVAGPRDKRQPSELGRFKSDEPTNKVHPAGAPPLDWWRYESVDRELLWWCSFHHHEMANGTYCFAALTLDLGPDNCKPVRRLLVDASDNSGTPLDWWNIPPGGYEGAHYAVWPPELLIKPIKAMCPEQVCRTCGEAQRRITEIDKDGVPSRLISAATEGRGAERVLGTTSPQGRVQAPIERAGIRTHTSASKTIGFTDCGHNDYRPGLVLDPFVGSGTTLAVATGHGRDAVGVDLDERNYGLALERVGPLVLQRGEVAA